MLGLHRLYALSCFSLLMSFTLALLGACKVRSSELKNEDIITDPLLIHLRSGEIKLFPTQSYTRGSRWLTSLVYEPLAVFNPETQSTEPRLAVEVKWSEEGDSVIMELRRNVAWHPYTALAMKPFFPSIIPSQEAAPDDKTTKEKLFFSAEDVLFTYRLLANAQMEQFEPYRVYFSKGMKVAIAKTESDVRKMEGIDVFLPTSPKVKSNIELLGGNTQNQAKETMRKLGDVDERKPEDLPYWVKISWESPHLVSARNILQVPILPKYFLERDIASFDTKAFAHGYLSKQMIGTGPFLQKPTTNLRSLEFAKNDEYKGAAIPRVTDVKFVEGTLGKDLFDPLDYTEKIDASDPKGMVLRKVPEIGYYFISYNPLSRVTFSSSEQMMYRGIHANALPPSWMPPAFADKKVREALALALDYDGIGRSVFKNQAERITGPFPKGKSYYDESVKPVKTNVERAMELLVGTNGAGFRKAFNGDLIPPARWCERERQDLCTNKIFLGFDADSDVSKAIAGYIIKSWNALGFNVIASPVQDEKERDFNGGYTFEKRLLYRDYDVVVGFRDYAPLGEVCLQWRTVQQGEPATMNISSFSDRRVDMACDELEVVGAEESQPKLIATYRFIHRVVAEANTMTFLFAPPSVAAVSEKVKSLGSIYSPLDLIY